MARKSASHRREDLFEAAIRILVRDGVDATRAFDAGAPPAALHHRCNSCDFHSPDRVLKRSPGGSPTALSRPFGTPSPSVRRNIAARLVDRNGDSSRQVFDLLTEHLPLFARRPVAPLRGRAVGR